jgi:hypothetical protein
MGETAAHASEETASVYEAELVCRHSAENSANNEDCIGDDHRHAATEKFEGRIHQQCTNEASSGVYEYISNLMNTPKVYRILDHGRCVENTSHALQIML